jgi:putative PIN family toxin of toxin-antitoxin system
MAELLEVLTRPKFAPYINADDLTDIIQALAGIAEVIHVSVKISVCRDPDDDKLLALAATGGANFIITSDDDLLVLNPFGNVAIVTPRQFVDGYGEGSPHAGT